MTKHQAMKFQLVIRCRECGEEIDEWEIAPEDPHTHVCEIASDLRFDHQCKTDVNDLEADA